MTLIARRPRLIAVAAVTAVAGLALAGWGLAPRTDAQGRALGPRMAISLVPPREPEITPGGVLEVGQLNDGFDQAALERTAEVEDPTWSPPDAYAGPDLGLASLPRMPLPRPIAMEDFPEPTPPPPADRDALNDGSRWFGLDRMRAEEAMARAERQERRARYEAFDNRDRSEPRDAYARPPWADRSEAYGPGETSGPVPYEPRDDRYSSE